MKILSLICIAAVVGFSVGIISGIVFKRILTVFHFSEYDNGVIAGGFGVLASIIILMLIFRRKFRIVE